MEWSTYSLRRNRFQLTVKWPAYAVFVGNFWPRAARAEWVTGARQLSITECLHCQPSDIQPKPVLPCSGSSDFQCHIIIYLWGTAGWWDNHEHRCSSFYVLPKPWTYCLLSILVGRSACVHEHVYMSLPLVTLLLIWAMFANQKKFFMTFNANRLPQICFALWMALYNYSITITVINYIMLLS